jgi:hypothetical protein
MSTARRSNCWRAPKMPIRSRLDLLRAIERLPNSVIFQGRSYKRPWLSWLSEYEDPPRTTLNRSARLIYNALNVPEWIIWLAAECGIDDSTISKAVTSIRTNDSRMAKAAAARRILPWALVAEYLENPKSGSTYDDIAPDIDAIYRGGEKATKKHMLVEARLGQGQFRANVARRWNGKCAVTGSSIAPLLRASHIKPWAKSSNRDRLNPANGIFLAAHLDALFDCGLISFSDQGKMLASAHVTDELKQFSLPNRLRRKPTKEEKQFLAYHRRHVFVA